MDAKILGMNLIDEILKLAAAKTLVVSNVDAETAVFRMKTCRGCEFFDSEGVRCKVCRCYLAVKTKSMENLNPIKLRYEITHCPKGFWGDLQIANEYRIFDGLPLLSEPKKNLQ